MTALPLSARERARAETTEQIIAIARDHLAVDGLATLSLRAIARDLGVVSSAVYRYVGSRDELLTLLVVEGHQSLGEAVEQADAAVSRRSVAGRWSAIGRAVRAWGFDRPHEYALLFGTPVPGYVAPVQVAGPGDRAFTVLVQLLADGIERGVVQAQSDRLPAPVRADLVALAEPSGLDVIPAGVLARTLEAWAQLHGTVAFEVFGRFAVTDAEAWFEHQLKVMGRHLGIVK